MRLWPNLNPRVAQVLCLPLAFFVLQDTNWLRCKRHTPISNLSLSFPMQGIYGLYFLVYFLLNFVLSRINYKCEEERTLNIDMQMFNIPASWRLSYGFKISYFPIGFSLCSHLPLNALLLFGAVECPICT